MSDPRAPLFERQTADPGGSDALVSLSDVSYRHPDAEHFILQHLRLSLSAGEMLAVLGPQGSGTTTLCRLIAGLTDADSAMMSGARRVRTTAVQGIAIGMLGDDPETQLTGLTSFVDDEVQLPCRLHGVAPDHARQAAAEAIDALHILHLQGRRLDTLSGGERQLVALAALMSLRPRVLVLDQPTLSLDRRARAHLVTALKQHCSTGGAVLVTGHQHDELSAAASQVRFLDAGRLTPAHDPGVLDDATFTAHGVWNSLMPVHTTDAAPERATGMSPPEAKAKAKAKAKTSSHGKASDVASTALLRVRGLSVVRLQTPVLTDLDLTLAPGEVVALRGANGSGKSTLLRALCGLLRRDRHARVSGSILVGDPDASGMVALERMPAERRAGYLGWVGQDPGAQLSASTVRTELTRSTPLPSRRARSRQEGSRQRASRRALHEQRAAAVDAVLEMIGMTGHALTHPYDLSPAERKDVVIASALLLQPRVLLLDEPTIGRDQPAMHRLDGVVRSFTAAGGAILATTHDHRWAATIADRSIELNAQTQ
ncbi:ATP-binding cassette domain-containing protein [Pseudoclavibacter sp. 13-3]|uniref:ATP-binding cassette domain-containing protein n=1 Tax=Pseudoclavibacter sp. 13-3 TaxID=2901228 RepID=UPI001E2B9CF4|nr:ABC transporter ATP-binding protein [Pseudoclavibacter sp. 13-3]MCD7100751.1 ATP-binding cassette domain-containing protein [Pseudoclavibacter sp. 13-3]